jgi:hypothetical protein
LVTPIDKIVPYSSGVTLQRIVTTVGKDSLVYVNGVLPVSVSNMMVTFQNKNYSVSGTTFNISVGSTTNPSDMADSTTLPITISNNQLLAFSASLQYSPALTPQNLTSFTSLSIPANLLVSQSVNLTLTLNNYPASTISLTTPPFFVSLSKCCIDAGCSQNNIQSCGLTTTSNNENYVLLRLKNEVNLTSIYFTVLTVAYQVTFSNKVAKVLTGLPSAQFESPLNIVVTATPLTSTLTLTSQTINLPANYTLYVEPSQKSGYIGIILPSFAISQLSNSNVNYQLTVNGSLYALTVDVSSAYSFVIPVTSSTNNITLVMTDITNPPNSEPFPLTIHQSSDSAFSQIYAQKLYTVQMTTFDPITVYSAVRNQTKVALSVAMTINITTPTYTDQMVINFPTSQITTSSGCTVKVNNIDMGCSVINSTAILTSNQAGNAIYTITGLTNQNYYTAAR